MILCWSPKGQVSNEQRADSKYFHFLDCEVFIVTTQLCCLAGKQPSAIRRWKRQKLTLAESLGY